MSQLARAASFLNWSGPSNPLGILLAYGQVDGVVTRGKAGEVAAAVNVYMLDGTAVYFRRLKRPHRFPKGRPLFEAED